MTRMVLDHGGGLALVKEILDNLAILFLQMILYYCTTVLRIAMQCEQEERGVGAEQRQGG